MFLKAVRCPKKLSLPTQGIGGGGGGSAQFIFFRESYLYMQGRSKGRAAGAAALSVKNIKGGNLGIVIPI